MRKKQIIMSFFILASLLLMGCNEQNEEIIEPVNTLPEEMEEVSSGENSVTEEPELIEIEEETPSLSESLPKTHNVKITLKGFEPATLEISEGDTIVWENVRTGNLNKAQINGAQQCVRIKSKMLESGDSFSWTFDKAETCIFVDVITTTQIMKVIIGE